MTVILDPLHGDLCIHLAARALNVDLLQRIFYIGGDPWQKNQYGHNVFTILSEVRKEIEMTGTSIDDGNRVKHFRNKMFIKDIQIAMNGWKSAKSPRKATLMSVALDRDNFAAVAFLLCLGE